MICGFGRTGDWFGCEHFGYEPDLMAMAKGISSGYLPIGGVHGVGQRRRGASATPATSTTASPIPAIPPPAPRRSPISTILRDEKIVDYVRDDIGPYMQTKWLALGDHPMVGEARMIGLIGALELTPNKATRASWPVETGPSGRSPATIPSRTGW